VLLRITNLNFSLSFLSHVVQHPVFAAPNQIDNEALSIAHVASTSCPIESVLQSVVLTSSGVLVACWQATLAGV